MTEVVVCQHVARTATRTCRAVDLPRVDASHPEVMATHAGGLGRTRSRSVKVAATKELQFRVEVVNLFNNVNLGNPDTEIGSPGSDRANAGRINSTAYFNADPQRNFQFAVKFQF